MSSRRSGRVAAQQLSKPPVSYREVNSDDETRQQRQSSGRTNTARGLKAAAAQSHVSGKQTEEQQYDDEVIVVDDGDADVELIAAVERTQQSREEEDEEDEVEEEDSGAKSRKRQRAVSVKQSKPVKRTQQQNRKQKGKAEAEHERTETAEEEEEEVWEVLEAAEEEKKPVKPKKQKLTVNKGKKGRKAAAGHSDDPIAVDDEDETDDDKTKKVKRPTKPKKEKQPSLVPHIRPVTTAIDQSKKLIGAHVGTAGGVHFGPHNAALMGARCFAMDTRSKRRWASAPYTATIIESFHSHMQHYGYSGDAVLPHGSYLTNLGCLSDELWQKSKACIREELERCQQLGVTKYVFHPGRASTSGEEREEEIRQEKERKKMAREQARDKAREKKKRLKAGEEVSDDEEEEAEPVSSQPGIDPSEYLFTPSTPAAVRSFITAQPAVRVRSLARLVTALNELLSPSGSATYPDVHILIETMAGTGNQLCSRFEELRYVIDALDDPSRIGVCVDTCHVFAADERYDMRQREGYERVMKEIEDLIGWQYVKGMHMNDSKCALGSRRDRHENIGDGEIGLDLFRCVMNDKRWDGLPIVLETPCKTEAKEAAKRKKKAIAAGEAVKSMDGGDEEEEDEDEEDGEDDDEEGGKKKKGKGKGVAKAPKEKEDWVKSYSEEISMLYGLEVGDRGSSAGNGVKKERTAQVKNELKEAGSDGTEEEKAVNDKVVMALLKKEAVVEDETVVVKKEKQKVAVKRGRKGNARTADEADDD